jgi:hypothetical protein
MQTSSVYNMDSLVRGHVSLGAILAKCGLASVPSPAEPRPLDTNYYAGGYISKCHSAEADATSNINCIQAELPASMRTPVASLLVAAKAFARALFEFYKLHSFHKWILLMYLLIVKYIFIFL